MKRHLENPFTLSGDFRGMVLFILAIWQQDSHGRHSIWITNMLQSGSPNTSGDNECSHTCASLPPILVTDFANRKPKSPAAPHEDCALTSLTWKLRQVGMKRRQQPFGSKTKDSYS